MTGFLETKIRKDKLKPALLSPKSYGEVMWQNFDNHMNWHHTVGTFLNESKIADDFLSDFHTLFPEADIRNPIEYKSDVGMDSTEDIKNWITYYESMTAGNSTQDEYQGFSKVPGYNYANLPPDSSYESKVAAMNKQVQEFIDALPPNDPRRREFKNYQYYVDQTLKKMKYSEYKTSVYSDRQKGNWFQKVTAPMVGMSLAAFTEPAFIATLPLAAFSGGATWGAFIAREAAIGLTMGLAGQTAVESQVYPFKKRMGDDSYTLGTSMANIAMVGAGGAVLAPVFGGAMKGIFGRTKFTDGRVTLATVETQLAKVSPKIRNKILLREWNLKQRINAFDAEIKSLINKGMSEQEAYSKASAGLNFNEAQFMNLIVQNVAKLSPREQIKYAEEILPEISNNKDFQAAKQNITIKEELKSEKVYPNTNEGNKVETLNELAAQKSLLTGEEMQTVSTNLVPFVQDKRQVLRNVKLKPEDIEVDAKTFQFKTDGDNLGVSQKLQDVKVWSDDLAQNVMVWQREDGTYIIADGHQRLGLAKRIAAADPSQDINLNATIRREIDGWTPQETMVEAMFINVGAGTAKAADVAKILRVNPGHLERVVGMISERSSVIRDASDLIKLSNEAWGFWLNNRIPDNYAALVGRLVEDPDLHLSVMQVLKDTNPKSVVEAGFYIREALNAGVRESETLSLFGKETIKQTLLKERGQVLKRALLELKNDKKVMATLVRNEKKIIQEGRNKLDTKYNKTQEQIYDQAIHTIEVLATKKGTISDGLTAAAGLWADGSKRRAIETFKQVVRDTIESGNYERVPSSRVERIRPFEETTQSVSQKSFIAEENVVAKQFDDPTNKKEFNQAAVVAEEDLRIESARPFSNKGNESSLAAETVSVSTQEDFALLQSTTEAPPSLVAAKATAESFQSLTEPKMRIGDFNPITNTRLYSKFDDIPTLITLAQQNIENVRSTLINISSNNKNATVKIRVKKQDKIEQNVKGKQEDVGPAHTAAYEPDILAGRIIVETGAEISPLVQKIKENYKVIREKDNFLDPRPDTNYRAFHIQLLTQDGLGFELQIHHKDFLNVVNTQGKSKRFAEKYGGISKLNEEQAKLYSELEAADRKLFQDTWENIQLKEMKPEEKLTVGTESINGELVNKQMTVAQLLDDIDNDKAILARLKDCV